MQVFFPSAQNRLEPKSSPTAKNTLVFHSQEHLHAFLSRNELFTCKQENIVKMQVKRPFWGARALKKNTLLRHLLLSRAQTSCPSRSTSCLYPFWGPKNCFFKPNNILPMPLVHLGCTGSSFGRCWQFIWELLILPLLINTFPLPFAAHPGPGPQQPSPSLRILHRLCAP